MKTLICEFCSKPFQVKPYRAAKARFCSVVCMGKGYEGQPAQYIPPKKQVQLTCALCGKIFDRQISRLKHGRGIHCSPECQYAAIKARPAKAEKKSFTCFNCGNMFQVYVSWLKRRKGGGKYCSRPCRDAHRHGLNHPQYIDGSTQDRGPNWQAQRRKALRRDDYTCQRCGGAGRDVHHITPFRIFGLDRYKEANGLTNLETLCDSCHRHTDADIQRAERQ